MPAQIVSHPVVEHYLMTLRDKETDAEVFRRACLVVTRYLVAAAAAKFESVPREVMTPLEPAPCRDLARGIVLVPILRAGLGMLHAAGEMLPRASVGYIGLERDETTAVANCYYTRLPELKDRDILLLDPMLATGGSACRAIDHLYEAGGERLSMVSIIAAPEGVREIEERHPGVTIYTACVDRELDGNKYIRPGLGDFGDRLYGT